MISTQDFQLGDLTVVSESRSESRWSAAEVIIIGESCSVQFQVDYRGGDTQTFQRPPGRGPGPPGPLSRATGKLGEQLLL
jgi:hypothetical protein